MRALREAGWSYEKIADEMGPYGITLTKTRRQKNEKV